MEISRNTMEIATACATGLVGGIVCYGATENGIAWGPSGPEAGYFPFYVGCLIMFGSAATVLQALLQRQAAAAGESFIDGARLRTVIAFFIPIVAMTAISAWLGLYIGMALYIFYAMRFAAGFRSTTALLTAAIVVAVNFAIFEKIFMVPLLKGPILEYFGIY